MLAELWDELKQRKEDLEEKEKDFEERKRAIDEKERIVRAREDAVKKTVSKELTSCFLLAFKLKFRNLF